MKLNNNIFFFDIDGLLLDSERIYLKFWIKAAEFEGIKMTKSQALQLRSLDSKLAEKLFLVWYNDSELYHIIRSTRRSLMKDYLNTHNYKIKKGTRELLLFLKNNKQKMYVVTSNSEDKAKALLLRHSLLEYFDGVISTNEVEKGKPYPDVYLKAKEKTGQSGKNVTFISLEDSPNGVISAKKAGCYVIMIPDLSPASKEVLEYVDEHFDSLLDYKNSILK